MKLSGIPAKIEKYLKDHQAEYEALTHKTVFTAYDAARTLKKELKEVAKNLLIKADKTFALIILPADKRLDLNKVKKALGAKSVSIPKEQVMIKILRIKPGALTSFGKLHKVETFIDKAMLKTKKMVLSTGSTTASVLMKVKDFVQMEEAKMADLAIKGDYKIPAKVKKQMKKVKAKVSRKKIVSKKKVGKKK